MRLEVRGLEQLPLPCIVVANHCSYLDGVVLHGGAAAELQLRDQARNVARAAGRHAAAPHRRRVRRARTIAYAARAIRAGCCATPPAARRWRSFPRAPSATRSDCCDFTSAPSPPRRARICRWCRSPFAARVTACRRTASGRDPALIEWKSCDASPAPRCHRHAPMSRRAPQTARCRPRRAAGGAAASPIWPAAPGMSRRCASATCASWQRAAMLPTRRRARRSTRLEALRTRAASPSSAARAAGGACDAAVRGSCAQPTRDTRGIYLWGGVGRGKTWLMDLFYDSLPLRARRRSHFHHFMRDVHRATAAAWRPARAARVAGPQLAATTARAVPR